MYLKSGAGSRVKKAAPAPAKNPGSDRLRQRWFNCLPLLISYLIFWLIVAAFFLYLIDYILPVPVRYLYCVTAAMHVA